VGMDTVKNDQPMPEPNKCPQCSMPLPSGALDGLCPACLLKMGAAADTVTDAKQPPFLPPSVAELVPLFPQLEILELIGKGGMGAVYKARQKQLDRIVALKILPPGIGHDAAFAERFAREAKALAKLNHPNIVTLYEFGDAGGQFYFLMEFVDGVNLRQLLQAGRISAREALAIVPQICDALQFAHDQGIVHRDIKPENILLDRRGRVKVADFGLAKIVESRDDATNLSASEKNPENLTDAGKTMGTPNYMSPEQIAAPGEVDNRADIYALGVVFYQMLTGELPGKKIEPPSKKVQIDVRLDEIVLRALEKNPELRFQQVSEVKTCMETIAATPPEGSLREEARSESEKSNESIVTSAAAKSPLRSGALTGFIVFLAIIVLAIGVTLLLPRTYVGVARVQLADDNAEHIQTECAEIRSSDCLRKVASDLKLAERWSKKYGVRVNNEDQIEELLRSKIDVQSARNTSLAFIWVYDEYAGEAADIANTIAEDYCALHGGKIIDRAILPLKPIRPNVLLNIFIGALLGLGFGVFTGIAVGLFSFWRMHKASPPTIQKPDRFWRWFAVAVFAMISIPILISIVGLLAAIAIPNFVKARARAQDAQMLGTQNNPFDSTTNFYIGQTNFPLGDLIEITSVERTKNQMTVRGFYNLVSHDQADIALYITTTNNADNGETNVPEKFNQTKPAFKGGRAFLLMRSHLVPGLPHISMYAEGKPFASIYFGNKEEAAEERSANWITNEAPASAETWSPASDEKPDFQTILNSAKSLMIEGSYEEALQRYLWYFDHSRNDAGQKGVRLSFALSDWIELGRRYPKAKQALIEIRDADAQKFSEGMGYSELFQEIVGINQYLNDDDATLALFKTIDQRDPQLAGQCFLFAENLLVQKGEYETCRKYTDDPQAAFERIRRSWQQMKKFEEQNAARSDEQQKRFQEMGKTNAIFAHMPFFPTPPPFADNHFIEQTRQLVKILVATGDKSEAEKIQAEALAIQDDARLKSAVSDAEQKIKK
jgi:serine/threonine protein kinase